MKNLFKITFSEYQDDYHESLAAYLLNDDNNTEKYFIECEKKIWNLEFLEFVNFEKQIENVNGDWKEILRYLDNRLNFGNSDECETFAEEFSLIETKESKDRDLSLKFIQSHLSKCNRILEFLEAKVQSINLENSKVVQNVNSKKSIHEQALEKYRVTCFNPEGFELFDYLYKNVIKDITTKGGQTKLSFFYRIMQKEKRIHEAEKHFNAFFEYEYKIDISTIKKKAFANIGDKTKDGLEKIYHQAVEILDIIPYEKPDLK